MFGLNFFNPKRQRGNLPLRHVKKSCSGQQVLSCCCILSLRLFVLLFFPLKRRKFTLHALILIIKRRLVFGILAHKRKGVASHRVIEAETPSDKDGTLPTTTDPAGIYCGWSSYPLLVPFFHHFQFYADISFNFHRQCTFFKVLKHMQHT